MQAIPPSLACIGLAVLFLSGCKRTPFSSPTALRDTNAFAKAVFPAAPSAADPAALDNITVAMDGATLVATMPHSSGPEDPNDGFEHVVKRLAPGEKLEGEGATFEMVAFSVSGSRFSEAPTNDPNRIPMDFFTPEGQPLSREQLRALTFKDWQLTGYLGDYHRDIGPRIKVWLGSKQRPPGYYSPVGCFDARTKHSLTSGNSWSQISSNYLGYAELRPCLWHATPMEFVVDVELDGKSVVETNAIAGMTVAVPGGWVRMLGIWDGYSQSWSTTSGSAAGTQEYRINLGERGEETNAVALFVTEPVKLAVHLELLDERGKEFSGNGGGTSGGMRMVGVRGSAAGVKQVRMTVFTNHQRVVLSLPPIPNLPVTGTKVANLFEVPIPRVYIQREYQLRELIGGLTQMRFQYPSSGDQLPTSLFPLTLTNVTPAELLKIYQGNMTNANSVVVDEQKLEIRVEPTRFEKIKRWIKQKLKL